MSNGIDVFMVAIMTIINPKINAIDAIFITVIETAFIFDSDKASIQTIT